MDIEEEIVLKKQVRGMYDLNEFYISASSSQGYSLFSMDELQKHEEYYKPSARMLRDMAEFINDTSLPDKKITLITFKHKNGVYEIEEYYFKNYIK